MYDGIYNERYHYGGANAEVDENSHQSAARQYLCRWHDHNSYVRTKTNCRHRVSSHQQVESFRLLQAGMVLSLFILFCIILFL